MCHKDISDAGCKTRRKKVATPRLLRHDVRMCPRRCLYSPSCPCLFAANELMLISILSRSFSSVLVWDRNPAMGFLMELNWDLFDWTYSSFIAVWKDQPFLTFHFLLEMTPHFLTSPDLKTLGCFSNFSPLDVCLLLIHINTNQLTHVTQSKWLGVLFVSAIPSLVTQGHERGQTGSYQWSL